jgi:predicted negative regulator of RcsB-dependent stress response
MRLASLALLLLTVLLASCAIHPPRRARVTPSASASSRVVRAEPVPPTPQPAPAIAPRGLLEEGSVGENGELTPPPQEQAGEPAPEQVAALPPAALPSGSGEQESLLSHIDQKTPPNVAAALRLVEDGRQQMNAGRYDRALDRFERALAIDPSNAYGYYFLALLHFETKKYDQAVAFASRAVVLSARTDRVLMGRSYGLQGEAYEAVGRYADARSAYEKAVEVDPSNLAARVGVARLNPTE